MYSPEASSIAPIMSVSQCTPDKSLAATANTVRMTDTAATQRFVALPLSLRHKITATEGITHIKSQVVDEGYEASSAPSMRIGR